MINEAIQSKKIIILDDEIEMCETLACEVEKISSPVFCATSVVEGLNLVKAHDIEYGVIDIGLFGETGFDFVKKVREFKANFKFAIFTGHESKKIRDLANQYGALFYLAKPAGINDVHALIFALLAS